MNKVLVLGASGGMGFSIVNELLKREFEVIAFARTKEKLDNMFSHDPNVIIHPGDVLDLEDLEVAARGVHLIFHAVNVPYEAWEEKLPKLTQHIIKVATDQSAKLAVVDNIYAYGMSTGAKMKETTPKSPHTKKGNLRLQMEKLIKKSTVPYIIVHFPDFYGPYVENGLINYTLRQVIANKRARFVGDQSVAREHIFTPDGAKAIVELALQDNAYDQNWNIPASDLIRGEDIVAIIRDLTGYSKPVSTVTKNMIRLLGLFNKQMREMVDMQYLNKDPVILDGSKYEKHIGLVPKTPYSEGLKETLSAYKINV